MVRCVCVCVCVCVWADNVRDTTLYPGKHSHTHTHKYRKHDAYYFINRMILKPTSVLRMACCLNPKADLTTLCLDHYRTVAYHKIHNYESTLKQQALEVM